MQINKILTTTGKQKQKKSQHKNFNINPTTVDALLSLLFGFAGLVKGWINKKHFINWKKDAMNVNVFW